MRESNSEESDLIIDKLVEYNLSKVSAKKEDLFYFLWENTNRSDVINKVSKSIIM